MKVFLLFFGWFVGWWEWRMVSRAYSLCLFVLMFDRQWDGYREREYECKLGRKRGHVSAQPLELEQRLQQS